MSVDALAHRSLGSVDRKLDLDGAADWAGPDGSEPVSTDVRVTRSVFLAAI